MSNKGKSTNSQDEQNGWSDQTSNWTYVLYAISKEVGGANKRN